MQLQFTRDERMLLAEILELQTSVSTDRLKLASYALLDRIISNDLAMAFDELEDLQEILDRYAKALQQLVFQARPDTISLLIERQRVVEKLRNKVTEACAMV